MRAGAAGAGVSFIPRNHRCRAGRCPAHGAAATRCRRRTHHLPPGTSPSFVVGKGLVQHASATLCDLEIVHLGPTTPCFPSSISKRSSCLSCCAVALIRLTPRGLWPSWMTAQRMQLCWRDCSLGCSDQLCCWPRCGGCCDPRCGCGPGRCLCNRTACCQIMSG